MFAAKHCTLSLLEYILFIRVLSVHFGYLSNMHLIYTQLMKFNTTLRLQHFHTQEKSVVH